MSSQKAPVSPVIEFIKVFYEMSARWSNLISIFAVHLRMGGIFLLAKVCEPPRMVFVR